MKLLKRTEIEKSNEVFNLHIEKNHNYIANDIVVSNCHESKAKALTNLMLNSTNAEMRIGFTGTMPLDDNKADWFTVVGSIGIPKIYANYESLFQNNFASKIKVILKVFDYELEMKKQIFALTGKNYAEEMQTLISLEERNDKIVDIAINEAIGNTLILFFRKEHGNYLFEKLENLGKGKKRVFYVDGGTSVTDRERIRLFAEKNDNVIIVASIQIFSTGVNITNLHNLIFGHFTKSYYRVLQSVGRVMRKHPKKEFATIYDIVDNLSHQDQFGNVFKNYALLHAKTRKEYYINEKYEVEKEIVRIDRKNKESETENTLF